MTLTAVHLEVLAGIAECPGGRFTYENEETVLPTPEHRQALIELRRHRYVFRRWGSVWHPTTVERLTKHGRAALAPPTPDRPESGILLG